MQKTKEKQLKATGESCNDNRSNSSNRISSFTPTYHPIIKDVHKVIRNTLRVTLESSDTLKQILPIDSIKLSSKRDRNLKEILAPAVPHAHRQKRKKKGACSKCYKQRCGLCKIGILVETNRFSSFTVKHKYHIFRQLNCISINIIYKIDCVLCKLGYVGSTSRDARNRWSKHKYDIKNYRIEQSGLVDHLHKGSHENQCFEEKLEYLHMTLIDQVVGEIIIDGNCKLCELEKDWINRLQTFKELK